MVHSAERLLSGTNSSLKSFQLGMGWDIPSCTAHMGWGEKLFPSTNIHSMALVLYSQPSVPPGSNYLILWSLHSVSLVNLPFFEKSGKKGSSTEKHCLFDSAFLASGNLQIKCLRPPTPFVKHSFWNPSWFSGEAWQGPELGVHGHHSPAPAQYMWQ